MAWSNQQRSILPVKRPLFLFPRYHYLFHSRYPASIFPNCVKALKHILASQEGDSPAERVEVKEIKEGGIPAALVQVLLDRQVSQVTN